MKRETSILLVLLIIILPVAGYALMHGMVALFPPSGDAQPGDYIFSGLMMLALIALGLFIPYWMLKLGSIREHEHHPESQEIHLADLPKDGD